MTALEKNCFVRQMSYVTKHLIVIRPHPDFFSSLKCPNCYLKTYLAAVISQLGKFIDCCNNAKQSRLVNCRVSSRVSVQGVESLWGDCRFIPADWGS